MSIELVHNSKPNIVDFKFSIINIILYQLMNPNSQVTSY